MEATPTSAVVPESVTASRWAAITMLALFALLAILSLRGNQPPAALGMDAPDTVFSAARAAQMLTRILGDERPHPTGSHANALVRDRIVAEFGQLGLHAQIQKRFACGGSACATVENIVAHIPGNDSENAVLLAAHYDSVGAGPGASDDGAGVAALLETARALIAGPALARDVWLLVSDGEELGLIGAEAFVREPEFARIATVINLEARGTRGASLLIETQPGNAEIIAAMKRAMPSAGGSSMDYEIYRSLPNDTDFSVFRREGRSGLNFAWAKGAARYHTPLDDLAHLDHDSLQHHGENALAMTRELTSLPGARTGVGQAEPAAATHDAVFFTIFGAALATWPVPWNAILLALGLALWLVLGARLVRGGMRVGSAIGAGLSVLATLVLLGGTGWVLHLLLRFMGAMPAMWTAQGDWLVATFVAAALPVALGCGHLIRRWFGINALALASLMPFAIIGTAAVLRMPGASYLGLLPLLIGTACGHLFITRTPVWSGVAALVAASLWFPYAIDAYAAIGHPGLGMTTTLAGLIVLPLLPALLSLPRAAHLLGHTAIAATVLCAVLSIIRPAFDADVPRPASLLYAGNADAARLYLQPRATMPVGFLAEAGFDDASQRIDALLGWGHAGVAGAALTAPALNVDTDTVRDGKRHIGIRLTSRRGATSGGFILPGDIEVSSIRVQGESLAPSRWHSQPTNRRVITLVGLPPEGALFEFDAAPGEAIEVQAYDRSPGIPPELSELVRQRDAVAMPIHGGDTTVAWQQLELSSTPLP